MNPPSGSSAGGKNARQPKSPAWKGSRASAPGQRRTTAAGGATWQQEREQDDRPQIARVLAVVLAVLLVGAFLYLALIRPRATPLVVFTADAYPLRMPPLAFAQEDASLLENVAQQNLQVRKEYRVQLQHAEGALERFQQALAAAGRGSARLVSWRQQAIVIYLAAHGAVDERGPCLIPPAADPYDSREWLPLKDILAAVKKEPSLGGKRKLLVLDCQRALSSWRSGLLDNRFAEDLPRAVQEADDPNLYVLAAAAEGQVAWPAPELRGSVFGYFLARGLRGEANPEGDSVSLAQLIGYVAPQVSGYVQARRAAQQQPVLLHAEGLLTLDSQGRLTSEKDASGKRHDFPLVFVDATQRDADLAGLQLKFDPLDEARKLMPAHAASAAADTTLQANYTLPDLWRLYDERRSGGSGGGGRSLPAYVTDPVAWGSVQQRLVAIQERLLAGAAYQPALPNLINELGRELAADVWMTGGKLPPLNLLGKSPRQAGTKADVFAAGENFLETYLKEQDPAKKEELARRPAPRAKVVADIYALFTRANRPLTADDWQAGQQVLGLHQPGPEGESIEGHFLTLLQKGLRSSPSSFPAALVSRALAVRQAAEAAATPADIRTHYAVERLLSGADAKRREAEDQLFLGDPRQQASGRWNAALDGDEETTGYRRAEEIRQKVSEAFRLRDEVWSELPLLAEWHFLRRRLSPTRAADQAAASARSSDQLVELMAQSIALVDQLELVAKSRDEAGTFTKRYSDCQAAYDSLAATWRDVRVGLDEIAGPLVTRENRYLPGDDIREVELVTRTPLLAADFPRTIFGLYLNTLDEWAKAGPPQLRPDAASDQAANTAWRPAARKFWQEFHRLLEYEFRVEYDKHLALAAWQDDTPSDGVLRAAGDNAGWSRLRGLLDRYDEEMQRARSPVWDSARSALAASENLRAWDRRVRVSAAWLCCFGEELENPVQSRPGQTASHATPARWLQEFDGAHLIAWHAARAANDFWGSGDDAPANSPPFFAAAARRCEDVLQVLGSHYTPLRYDPPGSGAADMLPTVQDGALAALRAWDPLKVATNYSPPTDSTPTTTRIEIQPASAASKQPLAIPPGVAALSVPPAASGPAGGVRFAFDPAGRQPQFAVPLPVAGSETLKTQAYALLDDEAGNADAEIAARLWYRGHVRRVPMEPGKPHDFVHTSHALKEYSAPTIEVRGKDSVRGSVMFIFDCSASMQNVDRRFDGAKASFMELLRELATEGRDGVRLGLRFYGRKPGPGQPPANPNPDRDVTEVVPVGEAKAGDAIAEMQRLQETDCLGRATPLYFAISQALDTAFPDANRGQRPMQQIVVISDGVNIPFDSTFDGKGGITINRRGEQVNAEDYRLLQDALRRHPDTQVTVKLFGGQNSRVEREQLEALGELEKKHASFKVVVLRSPKDLYRSIRDSFPKTTVELAAAAGSAATQPLVLNQETPVKEWPQDGLLLLSPDQRELRVMVAGETESTLRAPLALVGGEKVVVQFEGQAGRPALQFLSDVRRDRDIPVPAVNSGLAEPALDLRVAPLDPHRSSGLLDMLFLRLRAEPAGQRFTPRPRYAWIEVDPLGAQGLEPTIPVIDAAWENHTELPVLQIPVRAWPPLATRAKIRAWFRYTDPPMAARATLRRGRTAPSLEPAAGATPASGRWSIEEVGGEAGQQRKISVSFEANEDDRKYENLLGQAVWLSPPPDKVERRFAKDGSRAIHEFIYTRLGTSDAQLDVYVASRQQFERGAYFAELTVNVVD